MGIKIKKPDDPALEDIRDYYIYVKDLSREQTDHRVLNCFRNSISYFADSIKRLSYMLCLFSVRALKIIFFDPITFLISCIFSNTLKQKKTSDVTKENLWPWLNRILSHPLTELEKVAIEELSLGSTSEEEKTKFIDSLINKDRVNENLDLERLKELLRLNIVRLKDQIVQERRQEGVSVSEINRRQQAEKDQIESLASHLFLLNPAKFECYQNANTAPLGEQLYINCRLDFIENQSILSTDERTLVSLYKSLNKANYSEAQKKVNAFKEQVNKDLIENTSSLQLLAKAEYALLLDQQLSLSSAYESVNTHFLKIEAINQTIIDSIVQFHRVLQERTQLKCVALNNNQIELPLLPTEWNAYTIDSYFKQILTLADKMHKFETDFLRKNPEKAAEYLEKTRQLSLETIYKHIMVVISNPTRKDLLSIKSPNEREKLRHEEMAKNLLRASLAQQPAGIIFLKLLSLSKSYDEDQKLQKISQQTFDRLYKINEKILLDSVYSTLNFVTDINGLKLDFLEDLKQNQNLLGYNLRNLQESLTLNLEGWYKDLQQIWVQNLETRQEAEIESASDKPAKMAELFSQWILKKTLIPFTPKISFKDVRLVKDRQRAGALAVITKHVHIARTKAQQAIEAKFPLSWALIEPFWGAPLKLLESFKEPTQELPDFTLKTSYVQNQQDDPRLNVDSEPVQLLKKQTLYNQQDSIQVKIQWILDAARNPIYIDKMAIGKLILYAAFRDVALTIDKLDQKLVISFARLMLVKDEESFAFQKDNEWRKSSLDCYLRLLFSHKKPSEVVYATDLQRKYLIQFANLAGYDLPKIEVGQNSELSDLHIETLGENLQKSEIGLEGLEESVVQHSLKQSSLPKTVASRERLDALRARGGKSLSKQLLKYILGLTKYDALYKHEAIKRAIIHAYKSNEEEGKQFIKEKLQNIALLQLNPRTLALPEHICFMECGVALGDDSYEKNIETFNQGLIRSNISLQMVMGFAREITRLSQKVVKGMPNVRAKILPELLKRKIAYQTLKATHIDGKAEIKGFLKLAIDEAEAAIVQSLHFLTPQDKYAAGDFTQNLIEALDLFDPSQDPTQKNFEQKTIEKIFKAQRETGQRVTFHFPGFLSFGRTDIDLISGCVYFDGYQRVELPSLLQNHPHVRSLYLQDLPYVQSGDGSFVHFTVEERKTKVAQIRVTLGQDRKTPVIERRLPTKFNDSSTQMLQYLPLENWEKIPIVLAERMGVHDFWIDRDENVYGYSEKGDLILIFNLYRCKIIETAEGPFFLIDPNSDALNNKTSPLYFLKTALPLEEILIQIDEKGFWIPGINLKIKLSRDNTTWYCYSPTICGMVLDLEAQPRPCVITLKHEDGKKAPIALLKEKTRLAQELHHLEEKGGLSRVSKARQQEIANEWKELEYRRAALDPRIYLTLIPNQNLLKNCRERVNASTKNLADSAFAIATDSAYKPEIYLARYTNHLKTQEEYRTLCKKGMQYVVFEDLSEKSFNATDFSGLLFLLSNFGKDQELDENIRKQPSAWVRELAKYPFTQPLSAETFALLDKTILGLRDIQEPSVKIIFLYLSLLECEHHFLKAQKAAQILNKATWEQFDKAMRNYSQSQEAARYIYSSCNFELPSEVSSMLYIHTPMAISAPQNSPFEWTPFPEESAREMQAISRQSLIERLRLSSHVIATRKDLSILIGKEQEDIIQDLKHHSRAQVAGFYLEEFGMFAIESFYREFGLDVDSGKAFCHLSKEKLDHIFKAMEKRNWIAQPTSHREKAQANYYYSVEIANGDNPIETIGKADLMGLLSEIDLENGKNEIIADRIRRFLFQAAQGRFHFSWKEESVPSYFPWHYSATTTSVQTSVTQEKEKHRIAMLDAQAILEIELDKIGISITDFKRSVLINHRHASDFLVIARNAFFRYLVHKTEFQHISNAEKAPSQGERNQIELLSTPRQYSIDLLFRDRHSLSKEEIQEQIIQLAFLLFEEDYGARCNGMQVKLFRSMMLDRSHEESIDAMQARMGFGKTALLPLLALVKIAKQEWMSGERKALVRYVVPKAVLQDNAASFHERISHILGSHVLKDREFSRYQLDPKNKRQSFERILGDLHTRLGFYKNAQEKGLVLIQSPEIRQSMEAQELAFGYLLLGNTLSDEEKRLCVQCKQTLSKIRSIPTYTIFDELDATQDFKACEVNFTEGGKLPIEQVAIFHLVEFIPYLANNHSQDKVTLAREMLNLASGVPSDVFQDLVNYVTNRAHALNPQSQKYLKSLFPQYKAKILLIRGILLDSNIFAFICNKLPSTHFGVRFKEENGKRVYSHDPESDSPLLIAVPYEGTNTPKGLSIFENTEVAAIVTLRYYMSHETPLEQEPHLDFLIKQMQKDSDKLLLFSGRVKDLQGPKGNYFIDSLQNLAGLLDKVEIEKAKNDFYKDFLENPTPELKAYFGMIVVATQVRTDEAKANSDRYEMGSPEDEITGCSGTVGSTSSYFEKAIVDPAADGKMSIEIMGRENNAQIEVIADFVQEDSGADYIDHILSSLLSKAKPETRAIIDAAGLCKSRDGNPETIVNKLWTLLSQSQNIQGIEGIVYYGKDNVKRLYRGPNKPPILCTTTMEIAALKGKKYFSFYGQKNTRGSDIKQADGAHALVTMDENVSNNDAKQAVLRFRSLVNRSSGQTFTFVLTKKFETILGQELQLKKKKAPSHSLKAQNVVIYLRKQEKAQEERDAVILFTKELHAHIKQAAAYIEHTLFNQLDIIKNFDTYTRFLEKRNTIIPLIQKGIVKLEEKYGQSVGSLKTSVFIDQEVSKAHRQLDDLNRLLEETQKKFKLCSIGSLDRFKNRIDNSKKLFITRYKKDEVEVGTQNTGAEAVAVALAQAEAQALSESVAEQISEVVIYAEQGLVPTPVNMSKDLNFQIDPNWIQNPSGVAIGDVEDMKYLVHPDTQKRITISPHLRDKKIMSHFALLPLESQGKLNQFKQEPYLFVSQEEADAYLRMIPENSRVFQVVDLREPLPVENQVIFNMQSVLLINQPYPLDVTNLTTKDLRGLDLLNALPSQLLPHLLVKDIQKMPQSSLSHWMDVTSFGISRNGSITISFEVKENHLIIKLGERQLSIPTNNKWLSSIFSDVYSQKDIFNKYNRVKSQFDDKTSKNRKLLEDLKQKQRELAQEEQKVQQLISDSR